MISKLLTLVIALAALTALGQQKSAYSDAEAGKHIGEEATVTGKVFTVSTSGKGTTFLNFGARFPNHTFGGVIFASKQAAVGDVKQYEGKDVSLTGRIEASPDQKPQIVINRPTQIRLAGPVAPTIPAPVATTVVPAASTSAPPASRPPEAPASTPASRKIELGKAWNSPRRGGELVRKDLARLFGDFGMPSETTQIDTLTEIYPGITILMPLVAARKSLNLDSLQPKKTKVATPGFPQDSFNAYVFDGVFPGGFTRLQLITDSSDQVVSVLLVDSSGRTRVNNEPDTAGYHTFNFVSGDWKAANYLVVKHTLTPGSQSNGVVVVDTMLIDPTDPENQSSGRGSKSSSKSSSYTKPKTGKVLERSRWFVPVPIVNLILRCVGG